MAVRAWCCANALLGPDVRRLGAAAVAVVCGAELVIVVVLGGAGIDTLWLGGSDRRAGRRPVRRRNPA